MGGVIGKGDTPRYSSAATKLEQKMVDAMQQRAQQGTSLKSFNSVIMKFPKIDENLRNCRIIFQQFGEHYPPVYEDSNGEIDQLELKHCFQKLDVSFTDEEIKDLFEACDIYEHMGMKFNEFIVFLCLVYLLNDPAVSEAVSFILPNIKYTYFQIPAITWCFTAAATPWSRNRMQSAFDQRKRMGLGNLEPTFETLVDAFVFLDKNKDGYVSKNEVIEAINETSAGERSSGRIGVKRFEILFKFGNCIGGLVLSAYYSPHYESFLIYVDPDVYSLVVPEEMDWDKNGTVTFKEFLFAFTRWVGIDDNEDDDDDE
ncbi:unnamed protein product [Triticum turgidum subsp. durum]|uniref:EF-hand domain-containing protein n=1 Tax=Triticum turgidum subsp. durum TaxID=4567 RepID=A0A9R0XYK1_TRITD|nr:unnamed protein product [Triticum turgidum subsp. durum]